MSYYRVIPRTVPKQILVITGGHPFDGPDLFSMLDQVVYDEKGFGWTHVEHPAALAFIEHPELASRFDAFFFYDVPGQEYRMPGGAILHEPSAAYKKGLETLLEEGKPMLFMHHAFVGWPKWPRYADIIGGCFMGTPGELRGKPVHAGGYRFDVTHTLYPVTSHPVTKGLEDGFELTDQLYLSEVFEDEVIPLMRSSYAATAENFYSATLAMQGKMDSNEGWTRPPGSNLMVWARREKRSPIVYMQCGDGRSAYENRGFRKLFGNAVGWLVSDDARACADAA
jgi:hypothetical protein